MIIKSSTTFRNECGMISDLVYKEVGTGYMTKNCERGLVVMGVEVFEQCEEALKLQAKLAVAEKTRLSGVCTYTLEESQKRLETVYQGG